MNTKGVSPLIATVFLIAVSVALGSIVMSLGQDYVNQAVPEESSCLLVGYEVKAISYSGVDLIITIDNGDSTLNGFLIKLFNKDYTGGYTVEHFQEIPAYEVAVMNIPLDTSRIDEVYEIKIIPISAEGVCENSFIEISQESEKFRLI